MHKVLSGMLMAACFLTGCGTTTTSQPPQTAKDPATPPASASRDKPAGTTAQVAAYTPDRPDSGELPASATGTWIGASGASDFVLNGTNDTFLGVWVDVPSNIKKVKAPAAVALVIDTSGSMSGPKMDHARVAARSFVDQLPDGDILSIHTFDDEAVERVSPTVLNAEARRRMHGVINELRPNGSTNMFDGLRLAEGRATSAPATHSVRRVVLVSDGIANIGPSTPELLGALAARGADQGVQVTSLGVGLEYDENTLNALAVRSSGRLFHLGDPREMSSILAREVSLLKASAVTNAVVEVIPAPGVQLLGADGVRADWVTGGGLRVPLGTLMGGQHREMLFRVRVTAAADGTHPLASVRLHFADPSEGNLARVQEVVARYQVTTDSGAVAKNTNAKTQSIMAVQEAGRLAVQAAQRVNEGNFDQADKELAVAETKLREQARVVKNEPERRRIEAAAANVSRARKSTQAAAQAPPAARPAAKRASALDSNAAGMEAMGY